MKNLLYTIAILWLIFKAIDSEKDLHRQQYPNQSLNPSQIEDMEVKDTISNQIHNQ